jgi:alkylated DNA repair protein alkB family protein 6
MRLDSLEEFRLKNCPDKIYYIPNFISEEEEDFLIENISNAPKPKWTQLKNRRLQNWGGLPQAKGMIQEEIPKWLNDFCLKVNDLGVFENHVPNHVLINEYLPSQGL